MSEDPLVLGQGIAPDVAIFDGLVHVAFGAINPMRLELVTLTLEGMEVKRTVLPYGFDQSFPRFSAPWLVYRQDESHSFRANALHLRTGLAWPFTSAGGTFGLTANASMGLCAYEWKTADTPWKIWLGNLETGTWGETGLEGAPDGLDRLLNPLQVTLRKDTRGDVSGIWYPVYAGNLTVGELRDEPERPQGGIGVQLQGDVLRSVLLGQNTPNPRCATDGTVYAIVCWNPVRLILATEAELRALPPVTAAPPFTEKQPGPINTEKEPSVSTPNLIEIVRSVDRAHPHLLRLNTIAAVGEFTERAVLALHAHDSGFGLLSKQPGEKQYAGHAIDATIYQPTQQVIDIIGNAGARDDGDPVAVGTVSWSHQPKRPGNNWIPPLPVSGGPLPPPVQPTTPPPAPPVDLSPLEKRIEALEREQRADHARLVKLVEILEVLEARPAPTVDLSQYEVSGKTAVSFGHQHVVKLAITRKA